MKEHPYYRGFVFDAATARWEAALVVRPTVERCWRRFCRGKVAGRRLCGKCRKRLSRLNNPVAARLQWIKCRALARRQEFGLTAEDIVSLPGAEAYLRQALTEPNALHLDRIDPLRGYVPGNVRIVEMTVNCAKATGDRARHHAARLMAAGQMEVPF